MTPRPVTYRRHRFPPGIISHAVWLYYRLRIGRHLLRAAHHRMLRQHAVGVWAEVTCV